MAVWVVMWHVKVAEEIDRQQQQQHDADDAAAAADASDDDASADGEHHHGGSNDCSNDAGDDGSNGDSDDESDDEGDDDDVDDPQHGFAVGGMPMIAAAAAAAAGAAGPAGPAAGGIVHQAGEHCVHRKEHNDAADRREPTDGDEMLASSYVFNAILQCWSLQCLTYVISSGGLTLACTAYLHFC
jgi:hypothetical protein